MSMSPYDAIADWYDAMIRTSESPTGGVARGLLELAGDVTGQRVCDLACGQGWVARELARRGAQITGIDLSARLLGIAARYESEEPLGIHYDLGDAQTLASVADASYDGVTCNLALMDIPDLAATLRAAHRILAPDGWFAFSITHPCFQIPRSAPSGVAGGVAGTDGGQRSGYFVEGFWRSEYREGVRGKVGAHHRTLATYLNALCEARFVLERVLETPAPGEAPSEAEDPPPVPKFLVARWRKG